MKLLFENWRKHLKEYKEKMFPEYGKTFLKYIPKRRIWVNNGELYYEMHIGVDPKYQGRGVAAKIIIDFANRSTYPLFFQEARIINPNLISVLKKMQNDYPDRIIKEKYGWIIK